MRSSAIFLNTTSYPWLWPTSAGRGRLIQRIHGYLNKSITMLRCCITRMAWTPSRRSWKTILSERRQHTTVPGISQCCGPGISRRSYGYVQVNMISVLFVQGIWYLEATERRQNEYNNPNAMLVPCQVSSSSRRTYRSQSQSAKNPS